MEIFLLIIIGFIGGTIGAMGLGGGTVLIPMLVIFVGLDQKMAQAANLIAFIPAAIVAIFSHNKQNPYAKKKLIPLWLFGTLFALLGCFVAFSLDAKFLQKIFGVFLLLLGPYNLFFVKKN